MPDPQAPRFIPVPDDRRYTDDEMARRATEFAALMARRRSVRRFSRRPFPREVLEECIRAAGTAPSGANQQPWHFVIVEGADLKRRLRVAAETEERAFYDQRATEEWLRALEPLGTDADKPFLEDAPYLVAVFLQKHSTDKAGEAHKHYYPVESVGIATGVLIAALHNAGLATLTHTPSPMGFLNDLLERPSSERPFLLLVVGYPAADAVVPDIRRKAFVEICSRR